MKNWHKIQSGPKKCIHTLTWKILHYNRNYCIYTKLKFIPKILMSKECVHFFGPLCICSCQLKKSWVLYAQWMLFKSVLTQRNCLWTFCFCLNSCETCTKFKFIPKILMSKECIHFWGHSVYAAVS